MSDSIKAVELLNGAVLIGRFVSRKGDVLTFKSVVGVSVAPQQIRMVPYPMLRDLSEFDEELSISALSVALGPYTPGKAVKESYESSVQEIKAKKSGIHLATEMPQGPVAN